MWMSINSIDVDIIFSVRVSRFEYAEGYYSLI